MAKGKSVNVALLSAIAGGSVNRLSKDDGVQFIAPNFDPALIEVNVNDVVDGKALVRISDAGQKYLADAATKVVDAPAATPLTHPSFAIISGAQLPTSKRGGGRGGAPIKYPFDALEVGQVFFVPNTAVKGGNAAKVLGSTVSSMNIKYSVETGETKQVERTKRGPKNKAVLDANGQKIKETVTVAVRKPTRKFTVRPVEAGKTYGTYVAPENGALVGRVI